MADGLSPWQARRSRCVYPEAWAAYNAALRTTLPVSLSNTRVLALHRWVSTPRKDHGLCTLRLPYQRARRDRPQPSPLKCCAIPTLKLIEGVCKLAIATEIQSIQGIVKPDSRSDKKN